MWYIASRNEQPAKVWPNYYTDTNNARMQTTWYGTKP